MNDIQKNAIKKVIKEGGLDGVRIIGIKFTELLGRYNPETETFSEGASEYEISFSFSGEEVDAKNKTKNITEKIMEVIGNDTIIAYEGHILDVLRSRGPQFWSGYDDTGRDKYYLIILSDNIRTNNEKLLVDARTMTILKRDVCIITGENEKYV